MKALLDTNIIIHRETPRIRNENIGVLFSWLDKLHYQKCVHPITTEELQRHSDSKVVRTMGIKLDSYYLMKTVAPINPQVAGVSDENDKNGNDKNDTSLLNEVFCKRVDIFITEDKKIHLKAKLLNIDDRVFTIDRFIESVIAMNPSFVDYKTLAVKKEFFGNINITDGFFDSFRDDYQGFDEWFNRKSDEIAYICSYQDEINAFLFLKKEEIDEKYTDISPILPPKKRLKIGTFKVTANGFKLGERFLKIIFDNALKFEVEEIYVTIFDKTSDQERLIELLCDWGFKLWGTKETPTGKENVYIRPFVKDANKENPKLTFPFLSRESKVFLAPINPDYHTELFPDSILRTESPLDFVENVPHRNAIKKVYISHSGERNLVSGDIIVFYRTGGFYKSVVTTIGIVEDIKTPKEYDELKSCCRNRTAFNDKQLLDYWKKYEKRGRRPFVVDFLYAHSLPNPFRCNLKKLIEIGVIRDSQSAPRGFTEIPWNDFLKLYKEATKK